jgi:hypothetical protein
MAIQITLPEHWSALARRGLNVVVDPMVVHCGELFLQGAGGEQAQRDPKPVWELLTKNIHAIGMFFGSLILEKQLPIFNYGDTFDGGLNLRAGTLAAVNQRDQILFDVDVRYESYSKIKEAASAELRKLYAGPQRIKEAAARDCLAELAAADYRWQPSLGALDGELPSDDEKRLARFFLGGLIFSAYAQLLGGDHLMQPKRSRLFLAAALRSSEVGYRFEEKLFAELRQRAHASFTDLPWRPTFFPYLLSVAETPEAVLTEALRLRRSDEIAEYRSWLDRALDEWKRNGRLPQALADVKAVAEAVDRRTGARPVAPRVEMKATIADVAALAGAAAAGPLAAAATIPGKVDLGPPLSALWGWGFALAPGQRYRKILTRAVAADQQYIQIENRLGTVWGRRA